MKARNIEEARDLYEQECEDHLLWLIMSGDCVKVRSVFSNGWVNITMKDFVDSLDYDDFAALLTSKESEREEIIQRWRDVVEKEVRRWIQRDEHGLLYDMIADRLEEDNQKHREA